MPRVRPDRSPTLLVVEDDSESAQLLVRLFGSRYRVLLAADGASGLEMALASEPDVILLDVMMPGMDGFECCERLKSDPRTAQVPVVFITGVQRSDAESRGLALGAADFVSKPLNPIVLDRRVQIQVELKRAREQLTQLAATDSLTGLANRRHLDECLEREYARLARTCANLSVVLVDIDHFKRFNDRHGHVRGDECLQAIARAIGRAMFRPADLAARYGGEEFACILPDTSEDGALATAERVREAIATLHIPHSASPTAEYVTASFGVATERCRPGHSELGLLARADEQLYMAKANNRNSICRSHSAGVFGHH